MIRVEHNNVFSSPQSSIKLKNWSVTCVLVALMQYLHPWCTGCSRDVNKDKYLREIADSHFGSYVHEHMYMCVLWYFTLDYSQCELMGSLYEDAVFQPESDSSYSLKCLCKFCIFTTEGTSANLMRICSTSINIY